MKEVGGKKDEESEAKMLSRGNKKKKRKENQAFLFPAFCEIIIFYLLAW